MSPSFDGSLALTVLSMIQADAVDPDYPHIDTVGSRSQLVSPLSSGL